MTKTGINCPICGDELPGSNFLCGECESKNISTCTNQKPVEMTLESIKDAIAKIAALPPSLIKMRCSEDTYNYIKIATQAQLESIIGADKNYFGYGINVFKDDLIETGSIENVYSDGSTKTIKIF